MQDPITQSERNLLHKSGDLPLTSREPTALRDPEPAELHPPMETLKGEPPVAEMLSPVPRRSSRERPRIFLPQKRVSSASLAGAVAGLFTALLTIVITLVFAGTFRAASQQIAVDRLTVKTALALAGVILLNATLSLLAGFVVGYIVGRIAVRRRLGFLAGALAGAIFYLITFLVSLIANYPGNLVGNGTAPGSLVISLLLLCLWSIGGGLVSLFGAWIATVRHPYYMNH